MNHEQAFLQAIRVAPLDNAPHLIYADWLEEHGQSDRAEFIRLQCRLFRMPDINPLKPALKCRAEELLRSHWEEWVGPLRDIIGPASHLACHSWMRKKYHSAALSRFQRGFVIVLLLDAEDYLRHARSLQLAPIFNLLLQGGGRCVRRLAEEPTLSGLSLLGFGDEDSPLRAWDALSLAASPYLHGLSGLMLVRNRLGDEGVEALVRAPWVAGLTYLNLQENGLTDRGAFALAESPCPLNLQTLVLNGNLLSPDAVAALKNSPNLRHLTCLEYRPPNDILPTHRRSGP